MIEIYYGWGGLTKILFAITEYPEAISDVGHLEMATLGRRRTFLCGAGSVRHRPPSEKFMLHEDEGAVPMELEDIQDRYCRWIGSEFTADLFISDDETVAYSLFRSTERDSEGLDPGIFIRQFFVVRGLRRQGLGREAFQILCEQIWPKGCGILLDTEYDNHRAHGFWRSVGFSEHQLSFILKPSS